MNRLAIFLFAGTVLGSIALLWLSLWPGLLEHVFLLAILLGMFPAVILAVITLVTLPTMWARGWRPGPLNPRSMRAIIAVPLIGAVTLTLLVIAAPTRVAFWGSRDAFDAAASEVDVSLKSGEDYRIDELNRRVGFFYVDECGVDTRGGIYFRTSTGPDGIGPDQTSHGFVKNPNSEGTPFGAAHYRLEHLTGDWYLFAASDDY